MQKVKISLKDYHNTCTDGCCSDYGTTVKVNDVELESTSSDRETILAAILTHLGYDVDIEDLTYE